MKERLNKLMQKNGFIVLLFVIVCLVSGVTLYLSMRNLNKEYNMVKDDFVILDDVVETEDYTENEELDKVQLTESHLENEEVELAEEPMEGAEEFSEDNLEESIETSTRDIEEEEIEFEDDYEELEDVEEINLVINSDSIILPVDGPIITEYTSDNLVYSETLEAWIGHGAIDIGAEIGTPVKAAADGIIKDVYEDELWGIVIVIDHGNQLETRYSNLSTKEMIKVGTKVKQGDHISKVGNTAKIEMLMDNHLHFEVIKNGKIVDPRSIMR